MPNSEVLLPFVCLILLPTCYGGAVFTDKKPLLTKADDYKIQFNAITPPNNPATIRAGITPFTTALQMRVVRIETCGVIAAHIHPRGTEYGYVMKGVIEFVLFTENGARLNITYTAGEGVVIPQGAVHFARNAACASAAEILVVFDHPDPGVVYVGEALVGYPRDYLRSAFRQGFPKGITGNQFYMRPCACNSKQHRKE